MGPFPFFVLFLLLGGGGVSFLWSCFILHVLVLLVFSFVWFSLLVLVLMSGEVGPPHFNLNLPCCFVFLSFLVLFCLLCSSCIVLLLWVWLHLLLLVSASGQKHCFPSNCGVFWCNGCSKHVC